LISHLEFVIHRLLEMVGGWIFAAGITLVVAMAATAFLALNLYKFDKESCLHALRKLHSTLKGGWAWILASIVLLLELYCMTELHTGLSQRLSQERQALYVGGEDAGGLPTTQRAPQVSFLESESRTQSIVLPPQLTSIETLQGWNPEEARYNSRPALNVQDELVKDDKAIVLKRTYEIQRYVSMKLTRSDVELDLAFRGNPSTRRGQVYKASFRGRYTVSNPYSDKRKVHFTFPLPDNSGTMAGFQFKVDGRELPVPDIDKGLDWEGELPGQGKAVFEIVYQHRGARAWSYDVTGRREPIAEFHLKVKSDNDNIKFEKGSLFPTSENGDVREWNLQDQITSQSISLYFPHVPTEQVVRNLFVFGPVALLALATLVVVWARLLHTGTSPWRTTLATLSLCGGFTLASYLISYVPLAAALLIAFGITALLQWQALDRRLPVPIVAGTVVPFTFLAAGHTGLLLTSVGLVVLWLTIRQTQKG
jgi:hypothetical protein